jgi:hypothetical protein
MRDAVIIDLDGTLANIQHRLPLIKQEKPDWKSFYAGIPEDSMNRWCKILIEAFEIKDYAIILVTGRELTKQVYNDTTNWLTLHGVRYDMLLGRSPKDYRPDAEIKKEIYYNEIKPHFQVLFAVDDRQRVVDMWREEGLVCLQCDKWKEV